MKKMLIVSIALAALTSSISHAKIICNVNSASKNDTTFDNILYSGEVLEGNSKYILISKDSKSAQEIHNLNEWIKETLGSEKAILLDGSNVVIFSDDGQPGGHQIIIAQLNLVQNVNPDTSIEMFTNLATASGPITDKMLSLIMFSKNLNALCF